MIAYKNLAPCSLSPSLGFQATHNFDVAEAKDAYPLLQGETVVTTSLFATVISSAI